MIPTRPHLLYAKIVGIEFKDTDRGPEMILTVQAPDFQIDAVAVPLDRTRPFRIVKGDGRQAELVRKLAEE